MYRLLINLYEFGQFLRILLWIFIPLVIVSMLVTTWLHYRRKRRLSQDLVFALEGGDGFALPPFLPTAAETAGNGQEPLDEGMPGESANFDEDQKENIYKGILWMKEKYEQYRDMADKRYEQMKEELARTEKKYQELLNSKGSTAVASLAPSRTDAALNRGAGSTEEARLQWGANPDADARLQAVANSTAEPKFQTGTDPNAEAKFQAEANPDGETKLPPGTSPDAEAEFRMGTDTVAHAESAADAGPLNATDRAYYSELLEEKNRQIAFLQQQLDNRIKNYYHSELEGRENKSRMLELEEQQLRTRHLVEEKQAYIDQLEGQLVSQRRKIEDLVTKLQASSQQLLFIYEELDRSLKPANGLGHPLSSDEHPLNSDSHPHSFDSDPLHSPGESLSSPSEQ